MPTFCSFGELVVVGLEDSTAPYKIPKSNLANLVKFETCDKPYKKRNLVNFANILQLR